jgi:hypothetical protein
MGYCTKCEKRWMSQSECHCSGCHRQFKNENVFSMHRRGTGKFRDCMTIPEMEAKGLVFDKAKKRWGGKPDPRYSTEPLILPSLSEISGDENEKTIQASSLSG